MTEVKENDFKGQTLKSSFLLRKNYKQEADWRGVESITTTHSDLEQEIFSSTAQYNALGEIIKKTDPQNNAHIPIYDIAGRVKQIKLKKGGETINKEYVSDISYNPKGQRTSITYGNGVVTSYSYDPKTFQLTKLESKKGQKKLQSIHYIYDPVGNITKMEDESYKTIFPNNKSIDTKSDYHYDSLYRLIQATGKEHPALSGKEEIITPIPHLNNQDAISNYTEYYDFDYGSNITKIRHNGKNSSTKEFYISNKSNRSVPIMDKRPVNENDIDKNYDESGNLLKLNGSQDLHWNYRDNIAYVDIINRPSGKNDSEYYVYDSSGQRVRKVTETYQNDEAHSTKVDKIYFGDIEVTRTYQESDLKKEKYTVHIMDDKSRVALHHYYTKGSSEETKNSQSRYQLSNHLDSVALELNDNAEIMTYEEYLPFGGTALIAGKTTREITEKEYRYSGKERDNSTGLYYYGARYYAPCLSRWINPDLAGTVDGPNLYLFVGGNPINGVDVGGMTFMSSNMMTEVILAPYTETIVKKDFFRNGDKFYGIYDVRKEKGTAPYIIEARESGYQNVTINDLMERVIDPITKQSKVHHSKLPTSLQPDEESKSFLDHMMNEEHYNIKKYKQKAENLRDPNTRDLDMSKTEVQEKIKEIKKQLVTYASKGGINYITSRSDDDKLSNKIYFVLDDINMGIVPQKIYSESLKKDQGNNQYKDVTGQELRYLYRNRDNEKMMRNVVFLRDRKKVVAPWKSTELANVYEKNSNGKFEIKGQKILAQIWSEYKPKGKAVNSNEQTRSSNIRQNPNRG